MLMGAVVVELPLCLDARNAVLEALVEEVRDFVVCLDFLVSIEIGAQAVEVAVGQLLKSRLHCSSKGDIGILEVAGALVSSLNTSVFVDFGTATADCGFASGAG